MQTKNIRITDLIFPAEDVAVRPRPTEKDKKVWPAFLEFAADIEARGIVNIFSVRPDGDKYVVIDGTRRAAAVIYNYEQGNPRFADGEIVVTIREEEEYDALMTQLAANHQRFNTLSTQEIKAIQRIAIVKGYDIATLATKVGMSPTYLDKLLKLNALPESAKTILDAKQMSLANAMMLNKLPIDVIEKYLDQAVTKTAEEFATIVSAELNELKKLRQGGEKKAPEYVATPHLLDKESLAKLLEQVKFTFASDDNDYNRGQCEIMLTIFGLDEKTQATKKAEWEKDQADREAKAAKRKEEREEKKIADAKALLEGHGAKVSGL